jgi:1,2-diacylglycerol 3-beta-galactosyltransferase
MEPASPPEVVLFIVDAGGGHRASATALCAAAEQEGRPWRFRVVNIQDVFNPLDVWQRLTGRPIEQTYNELIRSQRTRFLVPTLRVLQFFIRRMRGPLAHRMAADLRKARPALAISLAPNFNAVLRDAVREALPGASFFVLLTDYADFTPHFWLEPGIDRAIVGSERAAGQARELGLPGDRITRTSGMVLHPRFYAGGGPAAGEGARRELGIPADAFVVMELFGGKGAAEMAPLSRELLAQSPDWHVIAVCGDNPGLCDELTRIAEGSGGRLHPLGFTKRIADYLSASDVLVTKPGPGSLAEAFHQGVPVVVNCNARTIPQERFNAEMVRQHGLGRVVATVHEMPAAVADLLRDPVEWERVRANVRLLPPNRAVYEALDVVEDELRRRGALPYRLPERETGTPVGLVGTGTKLI